MSDTYKNSRNGRYARVTWKYSFSVQSVLHLTAIELAENTREKIETQREAAARRVLLNLEAEHGPVLSKPSRGFPSTRVKVKSSNALWDLHSPSASLLSHPPTPTPTQESLPHSPCSSYFLLLVIAPQTCHPSLLPWGLCICCCLCLKLFLPKSVGLYPHCLQASA